jgi:hypothetical protein
MIYCLFIIKLVWIKTLNEKYVSTNKNLLVFQFFEYVVIILKLVITKTSKNVTLVLVLVWIHEFQTCSYKSNIKFHSYILIFL